MSQKPDGISRRQMLQGLGLSPFMLALASVPESMRSLVESNQARFERLFQEKAVTVESLGDQLVEIIREISRIQAHLWQQIPALALEYNGRSGYSGQLQLAYTKRLWELDIKTGSGRSGCCVDLTSGELVWLWNENPPLNKKYVLALAFGIEQINAQQKIDWMTEEILKPYPGYTQTLRDGTEEWRTFYDPVKQEAWRAGLRQRFGLPKPQIAVS